MIAKTASGYNHPALPGRFFQKKAELQQALKKAAWEGVQKGLQKGLDAAEYAANAVTVWPDEPALSWEDRKKLRGYEETEKNIDQALSTLTRLLKTDSSVEKTVSPIIMELNELKRVYHDKNKGSWKNKYRGNFKL